EQVYRQLPDEDYPEGLEAIILSGSVVVSAGPLKYKTRGEDGQERPFLNYVCFPQRIVPGTGMAKTVADDVALKQAQRNRWESIIEACGMRMGSPIWMIPNGSNVANFAGDPGSIFRWNSTGLPPGVKPERIPGQGIPLAFVQWIEQI